MSALYELAKAYTVLEQLIEDGDENDWTQALATLEGSIQVKCENIARLVRSLEAEADMVAAEYNRLKARGEARINAARRLKDYLKQNLDAVGLDKVKGELFTVALQNNPPACNIVDEEAIPRAYKVLVPEHWELAPNAKKRIVEEWKECGPVPGAEVTQGRHVRIR